MRKRLGVLLTIFTISSLLIIYFLYKPTNKIQKNIVSKNRLCLEDIYPANSNLTIEVLEVFKIANDRNSSLADDNFKRYKNDDFILFYPKDRVIYGEQDIFNLCPKGHCQDREMFVVAIEKYEGPRLGKCLNEENYENIENMIESVRDFKDKNPHMFTEGDRFTGVLEIENKRFIFGAQLHNSIHMSIIRNFKVRLYF